jgi:hypothetical protein
LIPSRVEADWPKAERHFSDLSGLRHFSQTAALTPCVRMRTGCQTIVPVGRAFTVF